MLTKVTIEARPAVREGIAFIFAGQDEDSEGEPLSEFVKIELIVPPLNFDSLKALGDRLKQLGATDPDVDQLAIVVDAIGFALKRNYRGVPRWLIQQSIDVGNMEALTKAFMDVSGLIRKEIEAGKAMAAAASSSIGTGSTAT